MKKRGKYFIGPASVYRRIISFIVDFLILELIVLVPFNLLVEKVVPGRSFFEQVSFIQENPGLAGQLSVIFFIISFFVVVYFSYFEYKIQQTPGKIILGLNIVPQKKSTFWTYFISNLTFIAVFPFTLLWFIDPIHALISPKNQRFMEKLTNLMVVQKYYY